jgi:hypothetical protein
LEQVVVPAGRSRIHVRYVLPQFLDVGYYLAEFVSFIEPQPGGEGRVVRF